MGRPDEGSALTVPATGEGGVEGERSTGVHLNGGEPARKRDRVGVCEGGSSDAPRAAGASWAVCGACCEEWRCARGGLTNRNPSFKTHGSAMRFLKERPERLMSELPFMTGHLPFKTTVSEARRPA